MARNETMHRYSPARSLDIREEAPEKMVMKWLDEEFVPEVLRIEDVLKEYLDVEIGEVRTGVRLLGFRCRRLQ